jgi:hypothetical protein
MSNSPFVPSDPFNVNFGQVRTTLSPKRAYKLSEVRDQLETVAFDIVRFKSDDAAGHGANLWQVNSAEDGDYIVSLYEETDTEKTASAWEVALSKTANALDIYYKGDPIIRVAASQLGIPATELASVPKYLPAKLAENKKLVSALLSSLNETTKKMVLSKYPELLS